MKRIQALIVSLLFLITNNIQASFLQGPNPYSFGPQGRSVSDLRDFAKPKHMARVLPNRPVAATDSSGNRVYYTPDGKMVLSISKDGSMSFSLGGLSKNYNSDGEFSGSAKTLRGSGLLQEIRNKEEKVVGYKTLNGDGKTYQTYDKDMNVTATYFYAGQGAKVDYVQNEMTKGRTYYDEFGREKYATDFDGYIQRTFLYTDVEYTVDESDVTRKTLKTTKSEENPTKTGLLKSIRDYGHEIYNTYDGKVTLNSLVYNETFFDLEGKEWYVKNTEGIISREYHYKQDSKGNRIKDYHIDTVTKNKTYYDEHGTASYTVNAQNAVITRYFDGYTVNLQADGSYSEVTKYDIDGKELYTTLKNIEYNEDGTISKVMDEEDKVWKEYHYTTDSEGNKIVDYVINYSDPDFGGKETYTWYENDKPLYVTDSPDRPVDDKASNIIRDFNWKGDTLVYTFDRQTQKTQWYNMDKELVYESLNERVISKNIYSKGQLVAKWDAQKGETTIYLNERAWIAVMSDYEPTPEMVTALIAHSEEINIAIANHEEGTVLNRFMKNFGWEKGAAQRLLTTGSV
jgi:hypothetical protein